MLCLRHSVIVVMMESVAMSEHHADTPEQVLKFVPKEWPNSYGARVEEVGQAIVTKIQRAADLSNENCDRALAFAHKLSMQLRTAEDRISQLYRVPEIVTRGRFPDGGESDSTWRTQEARHVGSDTIAPGFLCATGSRFGKEDQRRASGSPGFSTRGYLRWGNAHRGGQDRRCRTSDHPGLGVALQRPRS